MIKTARQLKDLIQNLSKEKSADAQILMQKLWESYRRKFSYAVNLEWNAIMGAVGSLYALSEKESRL